MIAELGHFALILAVGVALYQFAVPLVGAQRGSAPVMRTAISAALLQLVLVALAFAALTHAYLVSDFSVVNVVENSHSAKPLIYKISGVWGNHEGSMLLWVLILALYGAAVALFGRNLPLSLRARVLSVQGAVGLAFLLFIVLTSNPFLRLDPPPVEGNGLNPILQDPALAFHPPFLYAGYVGLSIAFAFAVAALIEGRVDAAWARWVRPWTLAAWMFLTIGIAMGSWWAYYELGWGGWWFWDPVENASFMPWLVATALLHSAIVVEKRNALKIWTVLLSILAFSLSLMGTFLVRSGVLTSVHAFAVDPDRGFFILMILCVFIGGSLALFAWRAPALKAGGLFAPVSREGGLVVNNLLLCVACLAVFVGTLYPLALEILTGAKISVGPPYFNLTFGPIILPLLLLVPVGPMLAWKRGDLAAAARRLWLAFAVALAVGLAVLVANLRGPWLAPVGMALACWLVLGALSDLAARIGLFKLPLGTSLGRLAGLPRAATGAVMAHGGLGIMTAGIIAISLWKVEVIVALKPGQSAPLGDYTVTFLGETPLTGPNFTGRAGRFSVTEGGRELATLVSEKRAFKPSGMPTTEVGLLQKLLGDVYVVMGDATTDGGRAVRIYFNPLVNLIWLGALLMFLGALLSLSDRRYRVGAPRPAPPGGRRAGARAMRRLAAMAAAAAMLLTAHGPALALSPDELLADPALEARARALSAELRCLVCQNQSIDDSDAPLARDLRTLVREQLQAGRTDAEIMEFVVARYGDFVLLKPRLDTGTLVLWATPFAALAIAGMALLMRRRRASATPERPLSETEREALRKVLEQP